METNLVDLRLPLGGVLSREIQILSGLLYREVFAEVYKILYDQYFAASLNKAKDSPESCN